MTMIRMRATSKMPEPQAKRMQYRTRMMTADIMGGSEFEVGRSDAVILSKAGWAEEVGSAAGPARAEPALQPELPRRGRPPKAREPEPEPEPEEPGDEYENMTVAELRAAVEARGHELEPRYYRRDELLAMARG